MPPPTTRSFGDPDDKVMVPLWPASMVLQDLKQRYDPRVQPTTTGWWYTYPSEKYESQLGWLFPTYGNYWKIIKAMFQTTNQFFCWEHDYSNRFTCRFDAFRRTLQTQKTETAEVCTPPFKVKPFLQSGRSKATRRHNITRYFGCEKWWAKYPAIYQHQIRMAHSHIVAPKIMGKYGLIIVVSL